MSRESTGAVVALTRRRFAIPHECPCCGAAPDAELVIPLARDARPADDTARALDFPYCKRCVAHAAAWETAGMASAAVIVIALVASAVVAIAAKRVYAIAPIAAAIPIALVLASSRRARATRGRTASCAANGRAVAYLGWSGTESTFRFGSPTYAARFAEANSDLVVSTAPLRKLLDDYKRARLEVPTPSQAVPIVGPPPTTHEWIAKIEKLSGRVARRDALRRALAAIHDPGERKELVAATCRAELAPVLDKLARAVDVAAKRHLVRGALAEIRADNIPDELQVAELDELEAKLRDVS